MTDQWYATSEIAESWRRYYELKDHKRKPIHRIPIGILIFMELQKSKEGLSRQELAHKFSMPSIDRALKILIKKGFVDKITKEHHQKGRPHIRYKALADAEVCWVYPGKKLGSIPFFGTIAHRKNRFEGQKISTFIVNKGKEKNRQEPQFKQIVKKLKFEPTPFVRRYSEEKQEFKKHKAWLEFQERLDQFRKNYPQEFKQWLTLERDKAKQRINPDSEAVMKDFESFLKERGIEIPHHL